MDAMSVAFAVVVPPVVTVMVVGCYLYSIKERNLKLDAEMGQSPVYSENCGGRIDRRYWAKPLIRFAVYADFIVISYLEKIVLMSHEISGVEVKKHLKTLGIHLYHARHDLPGDIVIWSRNCEEVKRIIEAACWNQS